jgi:hypothetical protein
MKNICGTLEGMWKEMFDILFEVIYWYFFFYTYLRKPTKTPIRRAISATSSMRRKTCNTLGRHVGFSIRSLVYFLSPGVSKMLLLILG